MTEVIADSNSMNSYIMNLSFVEALSFESLFLNNTRILISAWAVPRIWYLWLPERLNVLPDKYTT